MQPCSSRCLPFRPPETATLVTPTAQGDATALTSQVARLFFDRQLSKVEIASRLGISRFRVARLIDQARAQGLVRIEFRDVPDEHRALAGEIERTWGIDLCVVAGGSAGEATSDELPAIAASVVGDLIGQGDVVGIAWGSTLAAMVRQIPARSDPTITIVQLAGSSTRIPRDRTPGELARRLADRLGAGYRPLFAPAFVESPRVRAALYREPEMRETTVLFSRLDLAVLGIGALAGDPSASHSSLLESGVLTSDEIARLVSAGAIGDLVLLPFDGEGRFVAPELESRAVGISADELRSGPRVVAVAGGANKAPAIAGALRTGLIDVLVTDAEAGEWLTRANRTGANPGAFS
jgi:DNA-binding transcriptional regulator LsrR (DeoR family)